MRCSVHGKVHPCAAGLAKEFVDAFRAVPAAFVAVFSRWRYACLALAIAAVLFMASVYVSLGGFVPDLVSSDLYGWRGKAKILYAALGSFRTNLDAFSQAMVVAAAALAGCVAAMTAFIVRRRIAGASAGGAGALGAVSAMLGIGCGACGSVVLASFFGASAATAAVGVLPLGGKEFGIAGVLVLALTIAALSGKVVAPLACDTTVAATAKKR